MATSTIQDDTNRINDYLSEMELRKVQFSKIDEAIGASNGSQKFNTLNKYFKSNVGAGRNYNRTLTILGRDLLP
jgi:hypothetical protein